MKTLGSGKGTTVAELSKRVQEKVERISKVEDKLEERDNVLHCPASM